MIKLSEMTKEEKIGVLITVVYILYVLGDEFGGVRRYGLLSAKIFSLLSGVITSLIIPVIGWGVYFIFFKKK
jgi:hypothetical protein